MMHQQIEQRLQVWLAREAAPFAAPTTLQRRVLEIPASVPARRPWWTTRFSLLAAPAATGVVLALAVFASSLLNVFDRPSGIDGGLCNNRQVHQALDGLREAAGYRYEARDELYDFDVDAEFSFDDPQFAWRTGFVAEGAYRAPDRVREVVSDVDGMDRGYVEHLQIGDTTWRRTGTGSDETWLRMPNPLPFANMVYGYIQGAFPAFQVPGVTSLDWGGTPAPDDIPGSGGCTVATLIPGDGIGDIVGLRIDVGSGNVAGVYRGPPTDADVRHGAVRYLFAVTWSTPDESEFAPPADAIDAPPEDGSGLPPPTPVPAQTPAPDAWEPQELPLPDGWSSGTVTAVAHLGAGGLVAVGSADRSSEERYESVAVVWTSVDGVAWEVAPDGPTAEYLAGLAWDGQTLLAIGYRTVDQDQPDWEVWASPDGRNWELAASLGTEVNPKAPISTSHGWVAPAMHLSASAEAGGGVQIAPAVLLSSDGRDWEVTVMPGTGSGSLSSIIELDNGSLLAFGCESPGATNSTQFGEMCLTRPWRSDDGVTWAPGPVLDVQLGTVVADGNGLLAIGSQGEPGRAAPSGLYRSDDGETWTPESFNFGQTAELVESGMGGGLEAILTVDGAIFIEGNRSGVSPLGRPYPTLWRTAADGGWEELPIGFTDGGGYIEDMVAMDGRLVLVGSLAAGEMESRPVVWVQQVE